MILVNPNSKLAVVNLLADFILDKYGRQRNAFISVTDNGNFFIINGYVDMYVPIIFDQMLSEFRNKYENILTDLGYPKELSAVNFLKYNIDSKVKDIFQETYYNNSRPLYHTKQCGEFNFEGSIYNQKLEKIVSTDSGIKITDSFFREEYLIRSEFPFGFGLRTNRPILYYLEYVAYNIMDGTNSNDITITYRKNSDEESTIDVSGDSLTPTKKLKSTILDLFDFNFDEIKKILLDYDLSEEILNPLTNKPWLKKTIDSKDLLI